MGLFKKEFKEKEQKLKILLFGRPKVGKTWTVLKLAESGDYVLLISTDQGCAKVYQHPEKYKTAKVAEVSGLFEIREALLEVRELVHKGIKKDIPAKRMWVVVDTITHLQSKVLTEGRSISARFATAKDRKHLPDDYVRDMLTQIDWGINLALMSEVADSLVTLPCNLIYIALEKMENRGPSIPVPVISGQSRERFLGDADIILRMVESEKGKREFKVSSSDGSGDRFDVLNTTEPADLHYIQKKVFGN